MEISTLAMASSHLAIWYAKRMFAKSQREPLLIHVAMLLMCADAKPGNEDAKGPSMRAGINGKMIHGAMYTGVVIIVSNLYRNDAVVKGVVGVTG